MSECYIYLEMFLVVGINVPVPHCMESTIKPPPKTGAFFLESLIMQRVLFCYRTVCSVEGTVTAHLCVFVDYCGVGKLVELLNGCLFLTTTITAI